MSLSRLYRWLFPDSELLVEFNASLRDILDRHAPLVTRTVMARPSAPRITEEVKVAECNLRKAVRQWRSSDLTVQRQLSAEQRNLTTTINHNNE